MNQLQFHKHPYTFARISAMRALLLGKDDYQKLVKMSPVEIAEYLQTSQYQKEISALAINFEGVQLLEKAIELNFVLTVRKLRKISKQEVLLLVDTYLKRYDYFNLKSLIRAKLRNIPKEDIEKFLFYAGTLKVNAFKDMIVLDDVNDILTKWPLKKESSKFSKVYTSEGLMALENAIDSAYFQSVDEFASKIPVQGAIIREFMSSEVESKNILNILRLKAEGLSKEDIKANLILSSNNSLIKKLSEKEGINEIISELKETKYKKALIDIGKNPSLITVENKLKKHLYRQTVKLIHKRPLTVDVILGFLFTKETELRNLMAIAKSKALGLEEEFIIEQLVY